MLRYTPGESVVHRLDPRSKLLFQFGFAIAAFLGPSPLRLAVLFAIGSLCLWLAGLSVREALWTYRIVLVVLALGPIIAGLTPGSPWFRIGPALDSLQSVARVLPVLLVSAAYVYATPVRETRAAIQRTVPGKAGQLLGMGIGLTFRYVPVLREDLRTVNDAVVARGGDRQPFRKRAGQIATLSLVRALDRSDELAVALQARCFAWNPTLPDLRFRTPDYLVVLAAFVLGLAPVVLP